MTRRFTEKEKNILYKNIPLQKQHNGVGWEKILFIILTAFFYGFGAKVILYDYNPFFNDDGEETLAAFLYFMIAFIPTGVISFVLVAALFNLAKNIIIYPKYGKYAVEKSFDIERIEILQGRESEDFIIRIVNVNNENIEIKIYLKIPVEYSVKENFLKEIENYRVIGSEKTDIPLQDILKIFNTKIFTKKAEVRLKDFSTTIKLDINKEIYHFCDFLKTKYSLIYAKKANELLFVNFYGDDLAKNLDIIVKDIENNLMKIDYCKGNRGYSGNYDYYDFYIA